MRIFFARIFVEVYFAPRQTIVSLAPITLEELSICLNTAPRLASTMNVPVLSKIDPTAVIPGFTTARTTISAVILVLATIAFKITNRIAAFARGAFRNTTEKRRVSSRISQRAQGSDEIKRWRHALHLEMQPIESSLLYM